MVFGSGHGRSRTAASLAIPGTRKFSVANSDMGCDFSYSGAVFIIFYWAWDAPARVLKRRAPEGAALTKDEARALAFLEITYRQLAFVALIGVGLVWKPSLSAGVFRGTGEIWLFAGVGLISLAGAQAIRRWRSDRH